MRSMTEAGLDAAVIGNHEFDHGAHNLMAKASAHSGYDMLAANYDLRAPTALGIRARTCHLPSTLYSLDGLDVGVIGMANLSSLNSIHDEDNSWAFASCPSTVSFPVRLPSSGPWVPTSLLCSRTWGSTMTSSLPDAFQKSTW